MRAAIVGAGPIARQHLGALAELPRVQAVGVCDLSPVMAESLAERFGVPHWFTDFREMLARTRPDVVHIATPPASHFAIARECLLNSCHVFCEKPITLELEQLDQLQQLARSRDRWLLEDHNYLFNDDVQQILGWVASGALGEVRHVEVQVALDLFGPGSRFADADVPHPVMREPLGVVTDFITHLAYLAYAFVGPHTQVGTAIARRAPLAPGAISEFQALVQAARGTALLSLSGTVQPDSFLLRVHGTHRRAETNLFEAGIVTTEVLGGMKPLAPIRNCFRRARSERRAAWRSLLRKLGGGPGAYEGLYELIARTYDRLERRAEPPVSPAQIADVNRLIADIVAHNPASASGPSGEPAEHDTPPLPTQPAQEALL
jgi:predicted dehydrogenase